MILPSDAKKTKRPPLQTTAFARLGAMGWTEYVCLARVIQMSGKRLRKLPIDTAALKQRE
jgi:hypothetical protein